MSNAAQPRAIEYADSIKCGESDKTCRAGA